MHPVHMRKTFSRCSMVDPTTALALALLLLSLHNVTQAYSQPAAE